MLSWTSLPAMIKIFKVFWRYMLQEQVLILRISSYAKLKIVKPTHELKITIVQQKFTNCLLLYRKRWNK